MLRIVGSLCLGAAFCAAAPSASAGESFTGFEGAPPPFGVRDDTAVPVDFQTVHVAYTFDVTRQEARAHAVVHFVAGQAGFPMMDLVPEPSALTLDGATVPAGEFPVVSDPQQTTRF